MSDIYSIMYAINYLNMLSMRGCEISQPNQEALWKIPMFGPMNFGEEFGAKNISAPRLY